MHRVQKICNNYPNADAINISVEGEMKRVYRCFYSGVLLGGMKISKENDVYHRTKEHLINKSSILFKKLRHPLRNMVYASGVVNNTIGNMPLAAKLYVAEVMKESAPVDEMQNDAALLKDVLDHAMIEANMKYQLKQYQGILDQTEILEIAIWDMYIAETKLKSFGLEFIGKGIT